MGFKSFVRNQVNNLKFLLDLVYGINCNLLLHLPVCRGKPRVMSVDKIEEHSPKHLFFIYKPNLNLPEVDMAIRNLPDCPETLFHWTTNPALSDWSSQV